MPYELMKVGVETGKRMNNKFKIKYSKEFVLGKIKLECSESLKT